MKKETKSSIDEYRKATYLFKNFQLLNRKLKERRDAPQNVFVIERPVNRKLIKEQFRAIAAKLCNEHHEISTDPGIFGGMPHIRNVRLSVGDILAKLYVYGSTQKIVDIYSPHVSEEQVKAAIAYAQDFLEMACDPDESSEVDG